MQKQFSRRATFVIHDAIDLRGTTLVIPQKSTLSFEGGSIENGSVVLNKTTLKGTPHLLTSVSGSVKNKQLLVDWFIRENDLDNLFSYHAYALVGYKELVFSLRDYIVTVHKSSDGIQISNKTILGNNCTIRAKKGGNLTYSTLPIYNSENVAIRDINVIGSDEASDIEGSRHNVCITKCKNVRLENITTTNAFTDGLYLRDNDGIIVSNLLAKNNGRQGCSITSGKNITINNSVFSGSYRVPPMSGLDIEPSLPNDVISGVSIIGCEFYDNRANGMVIFLKECNHIYDVAINVRDCEFHNNNTNMSVRSNPHSGTGRIVIEGNDFSKSKGAAFQSICYSNDQTPKVFFVNNRISNANMGQGKDVRAQAAFISIHNVSSSPVKSDFGNITIEGVRLHQDESIQQNIYRAVSLYVDETQPYQLTDVEIRDIKYDEGHEFTDSYNDYLVYVPRTKYHSVKIAIPHTISVSRSLSKAITPSDHIVVTGNELVSLKEQVRTDLFEKIVIECKGSTKINNISREVLHYADGSQYQNEPLEGIIIIEKGVIK
ncbi:MAG: right-handed parallel beta-helix repeat-containing protein [Bacteroidaceae bacterium]|nr:right-handed parallel beta-helix repeat-containing protein [Bacteroidaceae bacterium]